MMLPPFDSNGNLPAGDYAPNESEFEQRFVFVNGSSSRERIYQGYRKHRQELLNVGVQRDARCILDGSFTTNKQDPEDIDIVVEVDGYQYNASSDMKKLLSGPNAKPEYFCDAYPLPILPVSDPQYEAVTQKFHDYWTKWFAKDRRGNSKGLVWTTVGGFK